VIVVKVELHSAITGRISEIARMNICNVGGTHTKGDYQCETLRGRSTEAFARRSVQRLGSVKNYPRLAIHVWHLVARSLVAMGYAGKELQVQEGDIRGLS
jgi:hypothetical protein